jgi:flavin reductase (DIM6/NTAB) family NADH-FMN oxidoreductase RutF
LEINSYEYRQHLSQLPTGITVVTVGNDQMPVTGVTINSFTSVSLEPPLVLFCLKRLASTYSKIMANPQYAINVLCADQKDLSQRCARQGGGLFEAGEYEFIHGGAPIVKGSLVSIVCERETTYAAGDHTIILGRVKKFVKGPEVDPLLFFDREYYSIARHKNMKKAG